MRKEHWGEEAKEEVKEEREEEEEEAKEAKEGQKREETKAKESDSIPKFTVSNQESIGEIPKFTDSKRQEIDTVVRRVCSSIGTGLNFLPWGKVFSVLRKRLKKISACWGQSQARSLACCYGSRIPADFTFNIIYRQVLNASGKFLLCHSGKK